jgi:hypothetical protein
VITKRQVYVLGGVDRLDAMTEDARRVLVNLALLRGKKAQTARMRFYAVATHKRGAIDPPERLSPWIEDAIPDAEFAAAKRELEEKPATHIEQQWMRDGGKMRAEERMKKTA